MHYIVGHVKPDLDSAVAAVSLQFLFQKMPCFERKEARAFLADKANFETKTMFAKFDINLPQVITGGQIKPTDRFVLVDHNEEVQRLSEIKNDMITDIFDHHKVLLNLPVPIFITIKPWGSTTTLIAWLMNQHQVKPSKKLAGLMISAILSDTSGLKSPTTTDQDKKQLGKLNKIAKVSSIDKLIYEIFAAKSSLTGLSLKQILTKDYKVYEFGSKKVMVNQIETVNQEELLKDSSQLLEKLKEVKKEMKLNLAISMITDILKINTKILVLAQDEEVIKKAFPKLKPVKTGVYDIGSLISRKKEIAPALEKAV